MKHRSSRAVRRFTLCVGCLLIRSVLPLCAALKLRYGYAPGGQRLIVRGNAVEQVTYTVTITTSLSGTGGIALSEFRESTNTAGDWLLYVEALCLSGFLVSGDYFICDNAAIHSAMDIADTLDELLTRYNVRLVFLPTYSPELNPCELVFSKVKGFLRYHRGTAPFADEMMRAFNSVTPRDLQRFYNYCARKVPLYEPG
jgi:hypothetical protein